MRHWVMFTLQTIKSINYKRAVILLIFGQCGVSFAAPPQSSSFDSFLSLSIEELLNVPITSASLFTDSSLDVGSTVTVIKKEHWQARGARRLDDALDYMPGFVALPHFLGSKRWVIRGFPNTNGSGVQTLWDGVPINTYPVGTAQLDHPNIQLNTLDNIEVIRGPGSALYGAEAFHGVVSMNAFESEYDMREISLRTATSGYSNLSYLGSSSLNNDWRLNVAISGSGQPDQDFEYQYYDGASVVQTNERDYNYNSYTASIKLESDQANNISHKLGLYYNNYENTNFFFDGAEVPSADFSNADTHIGMVKGEVKWVIDEASSLIYDLSHWSEGRLHSRILGNGNRITIVVDEETQSLNRLVYRNSKVTPDTQLSATLEHRNLSTKNAYRRITQPDETLVLEAPLLFGGKNRALHSILVDGKTAFSDDKYALRYGFRFDDYSDFGNQFTPRLGLIRNIDESSVVKLLYGNAFKAPTGNELYGSPFQAGNLNLKPEIIDTVELVYIKTTAQGKTEVVLFSSKWDEGIHVIDTDNDGFTDQYANVDNNISLGLEVVRVQKIGRWLVDVSGSYVTSKNKTNDLNYVVFPKYIFNIGVGYELDSGWVAQVSNRVLLDMSRSPDTSTAQGDSLRNFWRTDLNVTKNINDQWEIFVNIKNLFNRNNQYPAHRTLALTSRFIGGIQDEEISLDAGFRYNF